jgi:hypothetical protein
MHKECHSCEKCPSYSLDDIVEGICNSIVGETYYKWNSITKFYPSVVFLFLEKGISYPKLSQIKTRLTCLDYNIVPNEDFIKKLRTAILSRVPSLRYISGISRCNFVSTSGVSWKSTIYCKDLENGKNVFEEILKIIGEDFDAATLSITSPRKLPQTLLEGHVASEQHANQSLVREVDMFIHKVVLYCNGLPEPIILYNLKFDRHLNSV